MSHLSQRIADLSPEQRALLARRLQHQTVLNQRPALTRLARDRSIFPLSFAQERYWFLHQWDPTSPLYTIAYAVRLHGELNYAAWQASTDAVLTRHESLRTTFALVDGSPVQVINPYQSLPIAQVDLRHLPTTEREQHLLTLAQHEIKKPFDLEQGPLLRMLLLQVADQEHVLICIVHHSIFDGWSAGVLMRETSTYLAALANNQDPTHVLADLPAQYVDFAAWQRSWLRDAVLERQLSYWRNQLVGPLPVLDLPTDHPYPALDQPDGARLNLVLDPVLFEQLQQLVQREGATLFMVLLAAWYVLLHRYSRQEDILIGTPIANRVLAETEPLIGCLANTLVLREQLQGDLAFCDFLQQVRKTTLAAYEHQDVPFATLVEALQPERDLHHSPFFQVMFVLQNDALNTLNVNGLTVTPMLLHTGTAKFALTLEALQGDQQLQLFLEYKTSLFDAPTIQHMLEHYQTLLESIVANPSEQIGRLSLLPPHSYRALLNKAAPTRQNAATGCIYERFEAYAAQQPTAIALTFERSSLSYGELNARANQLAHYLRKQGVGPDSLVGLYCQVGMELVIAILGVLKAGGAYVPIDPNYPQERVTYIINDAAVNVMITQTALAHLLPPHLPMIIELDRDWPQIANEPLQRPEHAAELTNLAYVIYTSGSTGNPKGALITHANLSRLFRATEQWFNFNAQDVWTLFHSYAFDFSVWEIWGALAYGGRLVIVPFMISRAPTAFYELLVTEGVTVLNQTPSAFQQLIQAEQEVGVAKLALRYVIFGGEALNLASLRPWFEQHGDRQPQLVNMYGITETTVHVTYRLLSYADTMAAGSLIGQPIPDLGLYVLDAYYQPVPVGIPGELFVTGAGLAQGYLNRPELTAERFIHLEFEGLPKLRLYRTGDLVRYRAHGELEYLGRIDTQVKIRGFRIELGEIESALIAHSSIKSAVVTVQEVGGDQRLVAYIVVAGDRAPTFGMLRRQLKQRLPEYMLPATFIVLDEIPLTNNGKVNYRALPRHIANSDLVGDPGTIAPITPIEAVIARVWAETLGLSQVGSDANFFELGGHSLLATQVLSRLTEQLQVRVTLRDFFAHPTVAGLARCVEHARIEHQILTSLPIVPIARTTGIELSFAQQRMWFLYQMEPESAFYNVPVVLRISGALNVVMLEQALNELLRRHEILRTRFVVDPQTNQVTQWVNQASPLNLPLVAFTAQTAESVLWDYAASEIQRPFDLSQNLVRVMLLAHGDESYVLVLTIHHIAFDEWSRGILFQELGALYTGAMQAKPLDSVLPLPAVQYADYAVWHRYWLQSSLIDQQLAYWKRQLQAPLAELAIPTDYPRPQTQTFNGAHAQFAIPSTLYEQLVALARAADVTLFMLLLAAWSTLLARYGEQDEVVIGTPIANRSQVEVEPLIGFFANTLVLRTDLRGDPSFWEVLARVREVALDAYANQEVPFDQLVNMLQPQRAGKRSPLFQAMLVLQNATREYLALPGCEVEPISIENNGSRFELSLVLYEQQTHLHGWLEYNTDLFSAQTATRMLGQLEVLLTHVAVDPYLAIRTIPLLRADEQQQLLEWIDDGYDLD